MEGDQRRGFFVNSSAAVSTQATLRGIRRFWFEQTAIKVDRRRGNVNRKAVPSIGATASRD